MLRNPEKILPYPLDLVESNISDIDVALVVHSDAVRNVEQPFAKRLDDVASVRIENQDGVLINHFLLLQLVVCAEKAVDEKRIYFILSLNRYFSFTM